MIVTEKSFSDQTYWEGIARCKTQFVNNEEDPLLNPYLRKEVAESWIRSKNNGVFPWTSYSKYHLTEEEWLLLKEQNERLIHIAQPLISNYLGLASTNGHSLELFD
ncbi:MAG: sigma-54-dependent Fis family transcriptional regulator, partial [Desulfitobacterium hafniense]